MRWQMRQNNYKTQTLNGYSGEKKCEQLKKRIKEN